MQFSLALAQEAPSLADAQQYMESVKSDIEVIDQLVTATLEYAILDRAELSINLAAHDFRILIPAIAQQVAAHARTDVAITTDVSPDADSVYCDSYLLETVLRNLLYTALRFARAEIRVRFSMQDDFASSSPSCNWIARVAASLASASDSRSSAGSWNGIRAP